VNIKGCCRTWSTGSRWTSRDASASSTAAGASTSRACVRRSAAHLHQLTSSYERALASWGVAATEPPILPGRRRPHVPGGRPNGQHGRVGTVDELAAGSLGIPRTSCELVTEAGRRLKLTIHVLDADRTIFCSTAAACGAGPAVLRRRAPRAGEPPPPPPRPLYSPSTTVMRRPWGIGTYQHILHSLLRVDFAAAATRGRSKAQ